MATKQISKTLFKKLSALRATLSDEEQALMDNLLLSKAGTYNPVNGHEGDDTEDAKFGSHQQISQPKTKNSGLHIRFDHVKEIYIVE